MTDLAGLQRWSPTLVRHGDNSDDLHPEMRDTKYGAFILYSDAEKIASRVCPRFKVDNDGMISFEARCGDVPTLWDEDVDPFCPLCGGKVEVVQ